MGSPRLHSQSGVVFTRRECQVILLAARGHNPESISNQLGCAWETVKVYLAHIFTKLNINSQRELVSWYYMTYWQPRPDMKMHWEHKPKGFRWGRDGTEE